MNTYVIDTWIEDPDGDDLLVPFQWAGEWHVIAHGDNPEPLVASHAARAHAEWEGTQFPCGPLCTTAIPGWWYVVGVNGGRTYFQAYKRESVTL